MTIDKAARKIRTEDLRYDIPVKSVKFLIGFNAPCFYLTALVLGNPLNNVRTMVMQGLKWPPDVAEQTIIANMTPAAYANPI